MPKAATVTNRTKLLKPVGYLLLLFLEGIQLFLYSIYETEYATTYIKKENII